MANVINENVSPLRRLWHWSLDKVQAFCMPLVVLTLCSILLLFGLYNLPLSILQDVGTRDVTITGLHGDEQTNGFSYAYTTGRALLQLPQTGIGHYILRLRMGGPNGRLPLTAKIKTPLQKVELGPLGTIRVYQMMLPTSPDGDVWLSITSSTTQTDNDQRRIGVLLDWINIQLLRPVAPPGALLLNLPLVLLSAWTAIVQFRVRYRWRVAVFVGFSLLVCISCAALRGKVAVQPWWIIGPSFFVATVIRLSHFNGQRFTTPLRGVIGMFVIWRIALWFIAWVSLWYNNALYSLARTLTTDGHLTDHNDLLMRGLVNFWTYWDGAHYRSIASYGYTFRGVDWPTIAFFPLYPALIHFLLPFTAGNVSVAAVIVSNVALLIALLLIYDLLKYDFGSVVAYRTILFLLLFPTSFFFGAGYSESLALALATAALWAIRRQRWWLAGLTGFLLALTRLPGVMITPLIVLAYLQQHRWRWCAIRFDLLAALLPPLGLGLFMLFQWWSFGTPFAFMIAQERWQQHISPPWVIPQMLLKMLATGGMPPPLLIFHLVIWGLFIILTAIALWRLPLLYGLLLLLLLIPPYMGSWSTSIGRHVLIGVPAFVVLALFTENLWVRRIIISIALPLLIICTALFVNAFWVA